MKIKNFLAGAAIGVVLVAGAGELPFAAGERIAFLGDSITEYGARDTNGWVRIVERALSAKVGNLVFIEAGVAGNMSHHMAKRLDRDVLAYRPNWMFFSCGVNDTPNPAADNPGYPLVEYKARLNEIFDRCAANGVKVICLTATPVYEAADYKANELEKDYNAALKEVAAARKYPVVDVWKEFDVRYAAKADKTKRMYTADGTHLNAAGNAIFAKAVLEKVRK